MAGAGLKRRLFLCGGLCLPFAGAGASDLPLALSGHDPVAYFTEGRARPGSPEWSVNWQGARWHFASAAHRDAFVADPQAFAPQYGGHCAWAAARGYLAESDPNAWRIVEGRLFLNANARIQRRWERDIPGFIRAADANWPSLGG